MSNNMVSPPHNTEAERMIIGIIIRNNARYREIREIINHDDFYDVFNRLCWKSIQEIFESGNEVDHVSLWEKVRKESNGNSKKNMDQMIAFTNENVVTTVNVVYWAKIIKENANVRKLIYQIDRTKDILFSYKNVDEIGSSIDQVNNISKSIFAGHMPSSIFDVGEGVIKEYESVARGDRGIPFPWEGMNKITGGMRLGNLSLFVGRPNVGKSFTLTLLGYFARKNGWPALIVSPEMDKIEIAERFFPIETGVSYSRVAYGTLSDMELSKFKNGIAELKNETNLWIMDASDDITPSGIEAAVRATGAKLVVIDSLYKLKLKGERRDKAIAAIEWACPATKRLGIHIACFAQQNRDAEKSDKMGGGYRLGTIALADELAQDPDMIFSLQQTKDEKKDKILRIKPLKLRKGYHSGEPLTINWDWINMKYDEIVREKDDSYNDDPLKDF